jgi:hypothetical protein
MRDRKLNVIYRHTHRDYKGRINGARYILALRAGGTQLVPLDDLTDFEVDRKFAACAMLEVARQHKANLKKGAA